jgi:hypothetical protein
MYLNGSMNDDKIIIIIKYICCILYNIRTILTDLEKIIVSMSMTAMAASMYPLVESHIARVVLNWI